MKECIKKISIVLMVSFSIFFLSGCTDEIVFEKNNSHEASDVEKIEFSEDWYTTYSFFKSDANDILKIGDLDDGLTHVTMNDVEYFVCDSNEYEEMEGAYVYNDLWDNLQLKYYPTEGNTVVMVVFGEETCYYPISSEEVADIEAAAKKYYVTDTILGNDLGVHVRFAYAEKEYGNLYVNVLCNITNRSGEELVLATDRYFNLDNKGIIESGYCDYDYSRMSADATFSTWIKFMYPENANTYLDSMTMNIDGIEVSLADKPQLGEELKQLSGMYYLDSGSIKISIEQLSDGRYSLIQYMPYWRVEIYTFTLNSDNTFSYDGHACTWDPETHSFIDHFAGQTYYK